MNKNIDRREWLGMKKMDRQMRKKQARSRFHAERRFAWKSFLHPEAVEQMTAALNEVSAQVLSDIKAPQTDAESED